MATQPFPFGQDYAAAKAAILNATVSLAKDLAGVAFLASPLASFINGANLRVDGGYVTAIN